MSLFRSGRVEVTSGPEISSSGLDKLSPEERKKYIEERSKRGEELDKRIEEAERTKPPPLSDSELAERGWIVQDKPDLINPIDTPAEYYAQRARETGGASSWAGRQARALGYKGPLDEKESLGVLNQSPATAPGNFKIQPDGSIVPKGVPGNFRMVDTKSTSKQNENISKRIRTDRLNYGFTFEYIYKNNRENITLFINPEDFVVNEPARISVTQTQGGAFVDSFGPGLNTITIKGVTGYRHRTVGGTELSGHEHFIKLRNMVRKWTKFIQEAPNLTQMRFYNWADQEYSVVIIHSFQLNRNVQRPLLYQYNIQMTVVQDITEKVKKAAKADDTSQYLISPEKRAPLIKNSLKKNLNFVDNVLDKKVDLTRMSKGTQEWVTKIAKGEEYWNQAMQVYEPIENVISGIKEYSTDVEMFVNGVTSFISKPFNLVQDLANSVGDVITAMTSVLNVPHELVRSFNDMMCAIRALPETVYRGFTSPFQFEGVSNCGSTLGIPEAPVSAYNNSFTATAQVPAQRQVNQIITVPESVVMLQETPTLVAGVYVSTDTARTGINYFDKFFGKQVTLTSVPNVPIVVDYSVPQPVTTDMIRLQAAGVWTVSVDDTVERIALDSYDDASLWKQIVLFNGLEYPFIVAEDFVKERYATGVVRFYRRTTSPAFTGEKIIPKGQTVYVPYDPRIGTYRIDFKTTEEAVLEIGEPFVDVPIVAIKPGKVGNVAPRVITGLYGYSAEIENITNIQPTLGGKIWAVKRTGETLLIPQTETRPLSTIVGSTVSANELFGIDIYVNREGEMDASTEGSADLRRVAGSKNLVQALTNRLNTRRGFYPYHSDYGSNLPYYIGLKNDPKRQDLIRVDTKETCLLDSRIQDVQSFRLIVDGDIVAVTFDAIPIEDNTPLKVNLIV